MSLSITSFNFDKTIYNPGDTITLTVGYSTDDVAAGTSVSTAVTANAFNTADTASQTSDGSASFPMFTVETLDGAPLAVSVNVTDPRPGTWTQVSNSFDAGVTAAPFTGTAVLSSVA